MITAVNVYRAWEAAGRSEDFARRSVAPHRLSSALAPPVVREHARTRLTMRHRYYLNQRALQRARVIRAQLRKFLVKFDVDCQSAGDDVEAVQRCVAAGFFANAACRQPDGSYAYVVVGAAAHGRAAAGDDAPVVALDAGRCVGRRRRWACTRSRCCSRSRRRRATSSLPIWCAHGTRRACATSASSSRSGCATRRRTSTSTVRTCAASASSIARCVGPQRMLGDREVAVVVGVVGMVAVEAAHLRRRWRLSPASPRAASSPPPRLLLLLQLPSLLLSVAAPATAARVGLARPPARPPAPRHRPVASCTSTAYRCCGRTARRRRVLLCRRRTSPPSASSSDPGALCALLRRAPALRR